MFVKNKNDNMQLPGGRRAVAQLSTQSLLRNLESIKSRCVNKRIIAMVKANGYGHGIRSVSRRLSNHVFALGVASIEEAIALRAEGIVAKIILMEGVFCADDLTTVSINCMDLVVHDYVQVQWLCQKKVLLSDIWVKVDIGMGRLGFFPDQVTNVLEQLDKIKHLVRGRIRLMGHLSESENKNASATSAQVANFAALVQRHRLEASLCNSAAIINLPEHHYDFVRPGLALYGASPIAAYDAKTLGLEPVMTVKSRIIAIKDYPKGAGIGYGHAYICAQPMRVGVISFGYGDGYPRSTKAGMPILIEGVRCPLVGRISMDMMTVDLSLCPQACIGSEVTLWGQGLAITLLEKYSGISRYELFTQVQNRVKFIWD